MFVYLLKTVVVSWLKPAIGYGSRRVRFFIDRFCASAWWVVPNSLDGYILVYIVVCLALIVY